jgi:hypothetical protein
MITSFFQWAFEKGLRPLAIKKLHIHILKNVKINPISLPLRDIQFINLYLPFPCNAPRKEIKQKNILCIKT